MDDLRKMMLDAGAPPDDWRADVPGLIEAGTTRVRRRRIIAAGVVAAAAVVVTTVALAGLPALNRSGPDPVDDKHERRVGDYFEEHLSPVEVERRCRQALDKQGTLLTPTSRLVVGVDENGLAVPATKSAESIETRVGMTVPMYTSGVQAAGARPIECVIPQVDMLASPLPDVFDRESVPTASTKQVLEWCSARMSYDLADWSVLASVQTPTRLLAVVMSRNGYAVDCLLPSREVALNPLRFFDDDGEPVLEPEDAGASDPARYQVLRPTCDRAWMAKQRACAAAGVIRGLPDQYRVEITLDGSRVASLLTNQGAFAYSFEVEKSFSGKDYARLVARVFDDQGTPVWSGPVT